MYRLNQAQMTSKNNELVTLLKSVRIAGVHAGHLLMEMREGERYKEEIGEGINTWHDYLSQPDIGMSVVEANALIKLFQFCTSHNISDHTIARIPTPTLKHLVKNSATLPTEEILEAGATLSTRDFKERFYDHVTEDKGKRTYTYMVMKKCLETGTMTKVYEDELEEGIKQIQHG